MQLSVLYNIFEDIFMKCPKCGDVESDRVLESRESPGSETVRRRRVCGCCEERFTTYERIERPTLLVVKRDGSQEEEARRDSEENAISSADIGEMVLNRLADKNEVAYVRFASVYKNFKSLQEFQDELVKMQKR